MPGVAFRMTELSARAKSSTPLTDPTQNAVLGVLDYSGPNSVLSSPINNMNLLDIPDVQVPRLNLSTPFQVSFNI